MRFELASNTPTLLLEHHPPRYCLATCYTATVLLTKNNYINRLLAEYRTSTHMKPTQKKLKKYISDPVASAETCTPQKAKIKKTL